MDEKKGIGASGIVRIVFMAVVAVLFVLLVVGGAVMVVDVGSDCWTCSLFTRVYGALSTSAMSSFLGLQASALAVLSVCLALWMAYETYKVYMKGFMAVIPGEAAVTDEKFFANIYKRLFIAGMVMALFFMPSPRAVFGWGYETILNFGAGIGRALLERRLAADGLPIPDGVPIDGKDSERIDCRVNSAELEYESDRHALSRTTRDSFVCMIAEIDALRRDYYALGREMMKYGGGHVVAMVVVNVGARLAAFFGGRALSRLGTKKWIKGMEKKIDKGKKTDVRTKTEAMSGRPPKQPKVLSDNTADPVIDPKTGIRTTKRTIVTHIGNQKQTQEIITSETASSQRAAATLAKVNEQLSKNKHALDTKRVMGRRLQDFGGFIANAGTLLWILGDEDVRVGLAGIVLLGGFFFINLMFSFVIIEQMLILGVALILFPFLAVCWCFEVTQEYAVKSFKNSFSFAVGLVFLCLMTVACIELDNWILGGMLRSASGDVTTPRMAAEIIGNCNEGGDCDIGRFVEITGTHWYFLYILFAVYLNSKLLRAAPEFAKWFWGGASAGSGIGDSAKAFGKSAVGYVMAGSRKFVGFVKNDEKSATFIDRIGSLFGGKGGKP
ncbi:MAG: hypothetical protein LBT92_02420 [Rickettsiales bacterium]|nr:hypothetical protein [Rickettsiales bacterium]